MSEWAFKWKILFNPDITKQAKDVIFPKKYKTRLPPLSFLIKQLLLIPPHEKAFWQRQLNFLLYGQSGQLF